MDKKKRVKIGELNFDLITPEDPEIMPSLEIENDASMVLENVDIAQAIQLRDLLETYIDVARDS